MSGTQKIISLVVGLYIGKYYPMYVPIPQINQENINKVLKRLEELSK
jgi:hypothetical protein